MKKVISIPGAPAPIGPYSQAIVKNNQCFVSGQIPMNPTTGDIILNDIQSATEQVMKNISALIKEAGFQMTDIVKCSIFLKDLSDFEIVNSVYGRFFESDPPARETVQVARLPKDVSVEISCIALR